MVILNRSQIEQTIMALESVSAAESLIQSKSTIDEDDLEDGEIPSDEDDDTPMPEPPKVEPEPAKSSKLPEQKSKGSSDKFKGSNSNNKKSSQSNHDRGNKFKPSEDWAGDVEKQLKAALEEDKNKKNQDKSNVNNKNNKRDKNRKRFRDDKDEERSNKDDRNKRRRLSDEENNDDDDEMLFVRGASPVRKELHDNSPPPSRKSIERDNSSNSDYEDRPSRHNRDNDRKANNTRGRRGNSGGNAASGGNNNKNERGNKNKNRNQSRNERNTRRVQANAEQDPDAICVYYMQGKCHRGDDCPFSHNALPPRKMELCKFYLMDCCAKRDKCLYMHHDFPCKFFHTGLKCSQGENCKFSHEPLNEQVKNILLKHLETAPKEILGNFPRLSREGAMLMISNTEKSLSQGQEPNTKIPSLLEMSTSLITPKNEEKEGEAATNSENQAGKKDRKNSGKKTRWGSDDDRVPYEEILLLQAQSQLRLPVPNAASGLNAQDQNQSQGTLPQPVSLDFYTEANSNDKTIVKEEKSDTSLTKFNAKDCDLRQLLSNANKRPKVVSIADEIAHLTKIKQEEESDRDEETDLVIEMPAEEEDHDKEKEKESIQSDDYSNTLVPQIKTETTDPPPNMPKAAQELFMRIQQQQRAAADSFKNLENDVEDSGNPDDNWYSDDDDDDDDDDEDGNLQIVINDPQKDKNQSPEELAETEEVKAEPKPAEIPQPAMIVDKLGDLSKIDISAEVSKLLSTIKAHSSKNNTPASKKEPESVKVEKEEETLPHPSIPSIKMENEVTSPGRSPPNVTNRDPRESRDPRMSRDPREPRESRDPRDPRESRESRDPRDPRQRDPRQREETKNPPIKSELKDSPRYHRPETSIYASGITSLDGTVDTDLRKRIDQDHRRKDLDLRQCFSSEFGDTDLRLASFPDTPSGGKSDVDLRQMLSLPFKPAPSHMPCTEIDGSIASHPPMPYKVFLCDIPRPDYTGLKLSRNDPQVKNDPRLRKIFRISKTEIADSPMSPPPVKMCDTPKSPPLIRMDPRRKAHEAAMQSMPAQMGPPQGPQQAMNMHMPPNCDMPPMGMGPSGYMPGPNPPMMMGPSNMGGLGHGPMGPPHSMMGPNMGPNMGPSMGPNINNMGGMNNMGNMGNMGPMGPPPPMQMNFDPRYNQRNGGPGLLGPAPGPMSGYNQDMGGYDNQGFPPPNNFGPNYGPNEPPMRSNYGPNGPDANYGGNSDWNGPSQNRRGGGNRIRRRRIKGMGNNRGQRSPS